MSRIKSDSNPRSEPGSKPKQLKNPFIPVTPEIKRLSLRYRIPIELLSAVKIDPVKLANAYRAGTDRQYFEIASAGGKIAVFARPQTFGAYARENEVWVKINVPVGTFYWVVPKSKFVSVKPEEWYRRLSDWVFFTAERRVLKHTKNSVVYGWLVRRIAFVKIEEDVETWLSLRQRMIDRYGENGTLYALLLLLRYNPLKLSEDAQLALLSRVIPLVSSEPIHGIELSIPGTGKTSVAMIYRMALRWVYFNEPPTPASLAGDARTGRSPVAGAGGVWFDEIDKWHQRSGKLEKVNEAIEIMLTAMEQGLWVRGAGGEKRIEIHNPIPCYFSGNIGLTPVNPRYVIEEIVSKASGYGAAKAFNERIAYGITITKDVAHEIMNAVVPNVPRPSVLRGAVKWLRERYASLPEPRDDLIDPRFKGRFRRHVKRVAKALAAIFNRNVNECIDVGQSLVEGLIIQ